MTRATVALCLRALRMTMRRPQFVAPLVIFPTLLLAVNTGGLHRTTDLPGFPQVDGFLDFQLAAAMTQSLLLGGVSAGIATALDIEGGFFDRLVASPVPRAAIVLGRVLASGILALGQVTWFLVIGLVFGASVQGGVPGVLVLLAIGGLAGLGFGAIGVLIALRARNASTVQGIFPLVMVVLFVSSAFFPQDLLEAPADWVAAYNPLSYVADGLREPVIAGVTAGPVLEGVAASGGLAVTFIALAALALHGRLRTT
ncbi:ABC transporter permease [Conexibacter sp. SYSU D00693]|uniref:ABC transporter permease n=1 Tax=Conexibacter sp. SYSU D00693 TaxID=2812560 RepID=UPI00196B76D0|nr:ABC transporter permease [Conexibacter sp. SYSU D00693]